METYVLSRLMPGGADGKIPQASMKEETDVSKTMRMDKRSARKL
jgi:hypothetical protein